MHAKKQEHMMHKKKKNQAIETNSEIQRLFLQLILNSNTRISITTEDLQWKIETK